MKIYTVYEDLIEITSNFAQDVFIDYYQKLLTKQQALYMANLFLSKEAIKKLIDEGAIFKIAMQDNIIVGFIEYLISDDKVFLSKLYVHKNYRHQGIGKQLFQDCIEYTKENNLNTIYLTVNKYNTKSINTYKHLGFEIIDSVINDIGNNYVMDDYIMQYHI